MHHDLDLTKKGEAYALRHNPTGCPIGIEPHLWRKAMSTRVQTHLALATALLSVLDGLDGDCDLEETADLEASDNADDEESDNDSGVEDQPHDADLDLWEGDNSEDLEPSLGSPEIGAGGQYLHLGADGMTVIALYGSQERWANGSFLSDEDEEDVNEDGDHADGAA